jgi:hypothetical protein
MGKLPIDKNILVEEYNIDFNDYLDKELDKVKIELEELLKNTKYEIYDCSKVRPSYWYGLTINLYGVNNFIAKIEYTYGMFVNIKKFYSTKYILFDEIANQNKIYGPNYTKLIKLLRIEHIKECFENLPKLECVSLEDVTTKRIFTDEEYAKLFEYMSSIIKKYDEENKNNKVEISKLDLTKYIGQDIDLVLLELTEKLLDKYHIFDGRGAICLVAYSHSVYVYANKENKVNKINGSGSEVTLKGYITRKYPSYKSLKDFFGLNIDTTIQDIRDIIVDIMGVGDCRKESTWFGFNTYGLMTYCDSNNNIKLFEWTNWDGLYSVRPIENPCKNKNISDISLNSYIGKHINDVFLELKEELDEKYQIINCICRGSKGTEYEIELHSDENSILKVIKYKDGDKNIKIIKSNQTNCNIQAIDFSNYIGKNPKTVTTELMDLLDEKYIINPEDENEKNGIWIHINYSSINNDYDIMIVSKIEYFNDENQKVIVEK